jgi:putative transcriptional regulator
MLRMADHVKNEVQEYRARTGVTQEALAAAVGVSRQTIISIEKGHYTPSVLLALKIARYFKSKLEDIFYL